MHKYKKFCLSCLTIGKAFFHFIMFAKMPVIAREEKNGLGCLGQDGKEIKAMLFAIMLPKSHGKQYPCPLHIICGELYQCTCNWASIVIRSFKTLAPLISPPNGWRMSGQPPWSHRLGTHRPLWPAQKILPLT